MAVQVKKEKIDDKELDQIMLKFCKENKEGVSGIMIKESFPGYDIGLCVTRLTKLAESGKLTIHQKGKAAVFVYQEPVKAAKKNAKFENQIEQAIYDTVRSTGRKGIWMKQLRESMNVGYQQAIASLKALKAKELVKEVTAGPGGNKRIWLLYDLEPDAEYVTSRGGPWFGETNGDFDEDIARKLTNATQEVILRRFMLHQADPAGPFIGREKSFISAEEIYDALKSQMIVKVAYTSANIESLCEVLVWDRVVEKKITSTGAEYRHAKPIIEESGFTSIPCGYCPVMDECSEQGVISPLTCVYYKKWLKDAETADIPIPESTAAYWK